MAALKAQIRRFLIQANSHGYATGNNKKWIKEKDGSTTIVFKKGDWKYHDNYFGGEPYGGREVVFYKNEPVFMLLYYGTIVKSVSNFPDIYKFLQHALTADPESNPYRGPKSFKEGEFRYENEWSGDVDAFSGEEIIYRKSKEIYRARYFGGLVDQRKE